VAVNASPFLRFDGYFILCDWLDMPNLHARSFALARWKLREWLFALGDARPEHFAKQKERWLILFAWGTWLYRLVVFLGIALLVYGFFFKALGIFLAAVELVWFIGLPLWRELKVWCERWPQIRAQAASRRRSWRSALILVLLLVMLAVPLPGRVSASGVLRPVDLWPVFVPVDAQIADLYLKPGDVAAGERLAALRSPDLHTRMRVLGARLEQLQRQAAFASLAPETRQRMQVHQEAWATAAAEFATLEQERQRLEPQAPFSGSLRDIDPDLKPGQWLPAQHKLGVLVGFDQMLVETYLDENAVRQVRVGDAGLFIIDGGEGPALQLRLVQVDADATRVLPSGLLSAAAGGHVLTRASQGQHVPEAAVYRVVLEVTSDPGPLAGQSWRGRLVIRSQPRALGSQYLRQAMGVLLRETGF
jgi:putative peptide zinc metalloprotease protein